MFDTHEILNLVGQLGGNHQQAAQEFAGQPQVDPMQMGGRLERYGIDPQQLQDGGYEQHFQAQQQPDFDGYQPGQDFTQQQPAFDGQRQQYGGESDQGFQQQGGSGNDQQPDHDQEGQRF